MCSGRFRKPAPGLVLSGRLAETRGVAQSGVTVVQEVGDLSSSDWLELLAARRGLERDGPSCVEHEATTLFETLRKKVGANRGSIVIARRLHSARSTDPLGGWRIAWVFVPSMPQLSNAFQRGASRLRWTDRERQWFDLSGTHRVGYDHSYDEFTSTVHWTHVAFARLLGVRFRLRCVCSISADTEVYLLPSRSTDVAFGPTEANLALAAMYAWEPVLRSWARRLGILDGGRVLTPRERSVLDELLRGTSEKQAADALGLKHKYVHQVVNRLYRTFSVNSRAELLSLCLGARDAPATDWNGRLFDAGQIHLERDQAQVSMASVEGRAQPLVEPSND